MRKHLSKILVLALALLLVFTLFACDKDEKKPDPKPNTPPEPVEPNINDLWGDAIKAVLENIKVNGGKNMGVDVSLDLGYAEGETSFNYGLDFTGNIDINAGSSDGNKATLALYDNKAGKQLISIAADNQYFYFAVGEHKYKFDNVDLYAIIKAFAGEQPNKDINIGSFAPIIGGFGNILFTGGAVNEAGTVYTFDFSLKALISNPLVGQLGSVIGVDLVETVLGLFGAASIEEMTDVTAELVITLGEGNALSNFTIKDLSLGDMAITLSADKLVLGLTPVTVTMPNADDYTTAQLGRFTGNGTLSFMKSTDAGFESFIDYDWMLDTSIDIGALLENKLDFTTLDDSDYIYFAISHTCPEGNKAHSAYCNTKMKQAEGPIIEIAWSKGEFNSHNLFLTVALKALLNEVGVKKMLGGSYDMAAGFLVDYLFASIQPEALLAGSEGKPEDVIVDKATAEALELGGIDIMGIIDTVKKVIGHLAFSSEDTSLTVNVGGLLDDLAPDVKPTLNDLLAGAETPLDGVKIAVNDFAVGAPATDPALDLYEKVVTSKSDKFYGYSASSNDGVILNWKVQQKEADGTDLNAQGIIPIYDSASNNKVLYDHTTTITPELLYSIVTGDKAAYIMLDLTKGDKSIVQKKRKILGIRGVDYTKLNQVQEIEYIIENPNFLINFLALGQIEKALGITLNDYIPATVKGKIILSEAEVTFVPDYADEKLTVHAGDSITKYTHPGSFQVKIGDDVKIYKANIRFTEKSVEDGTLFGKDKAGSKSGKAIIVYYYGAYRFEQEFTVIGVKSHEFKANMEANFPEFKVGVFESISGGCKVNVTFDDDTTKSVSGSLNNADSQLFDGSKAIKVGTDTLKMTWLDLSEEFTVEVLGIADEEGAFIATPKPTTLGTINGNTVTYELNTSKYIERNVVFNIKYTDGHTATITQRCTITNNDDVVSAAGKMQKAGTVTLNWSLGDRSGTITVVIEAPPAA